MFQLLPQWTSSEPSEQSFSPSQCQLDGMQLWCSEHWNSSSRSHVLLPTFIKPHQLTFFTLANTSANNPESYLAKHTIKNGSQMTQNMYLTSHIIKTLAGILKPPKETQWKQVGWSWQPESPHNWTPPHNWLNISSDYKSIERTNKKWNLKFHEYPHWDLYACASAQDSSCKNEVNNATFKTKITHCSRMQN